MHLTGSVLDITIQLYFLANGGLLLRIAQSGAFNGSGIALASQSFARLGEDPTHGSLVMYFQHHTGDIRYVQLSSEGEWLGGSYSETVARDAKNNTPLSAVAYSVGGENTWHVFCEYKGNSACVVQC